MTFQTTKAFFGHRQGNIKLPYLLSAQLCVTIRTQDITAGVLHHLLRIRDLRQLLSHPAMGFSWEAMVAEEILRGLHNHGIKHDCYYYRTVSGAEVNLIIEGRFGTIPFEIKYQQNISSGKIRAIRDFVREHDLSVGIVIDNGETVRRLDESIIAIPFSHCI